jgi:ureidoglycolate hydrolase
MDESFLEIRDYDGSGYQPLIDFGEWRVAMLRYLDEIHPDHIASMERHTQTDEVFVLLEGRGLLLLGGKCSQVDGLYPQTIESGNVYNVKQNVWHTILLSRDAKILLVENRDTSTHNSKYFQLLPDQRRLIKEIAERESFVE